MVHGKQSASETTWASRVCGAVQAGVPQLNRTSTAAFVTTSCWKEELGRNKAKEMVLLLWIFTKMWPTKGKPEFLSCTGTDL